MSEKRSAALYVVVEADATAPQRVAAAVTVRGVQSILIRPQTGAALVAATLRPLVEMVQRAGIAVLVQGDARLARTVKADGVHLAWSEQVAEAYAEARATLGSRAIIGVEAGGIRHDAMVLAEAGADYVGFGLSGGEGIDQRGIDQRELRAELVGWWGEIFEVACVAFDVTDRVEAEELARDGADFIGLAPVRGETLADFARRLEDCAAALREA